MAKQKKKNKNKNTWTTICHKGQFFHLCNCLSWRLLIITLHKMSHEQRTIWQSKIALKSSTSNQQIQAHKAQIRWASARGRPNNSNKNKQTSAGRFQAYLSASQGHVYPSFFPKLQGRRNRGITKAERRRERRQVQVFSNSWLSNERQRRGCWRTAIRGGWMRERGGV